MELLKRFKDFISSEKLCDPEEHRILLGVSGGRDSVLMLHLFVQAGYRCGLAHCHFGLRGEDADRDEELVLEYARDLALPVYVRHFDTTTYADRHGISIQMAARELRYRWFRELAESLGFDRTAVAHHGTDQVETILINQIRGTGVRGFQGMKPRNGQLIRPLLFFTAAEVTEAVQELGLSYRDDQSNFSTDYLRNRLRWEVLPILRELNPGLEQSFAHNARAARQASDFLELQVTQYRKKWFSRSTDRDVLDLQELRVHPQAEFLIYELLQPYGFSASLCTDIYRTLKQQGSKAGDQSGKQFFSPEYELLLDREKAFIRRKTAHATDKDLGSQSHVVRVPPSRSDAMILHPNQSPVYWSEQGIKVQKTPREAFDCNIFHQEASKYKAFFDADQVLFPIRIRSWQSGDRFKPFGMGGKQKKISDLFTELKIALWEKENIPIIEDAKGTILWVAPFRQSWEYNICDKTFNVLTLSYFCEDGE